MGFGMVLFRPRLGDTEREVGRGGGRERKKYFSSESRNHNSDESHGTSAVFLVHVVSDICR